MKQRSAPLPPGRAARVEGGVELRVVLPLHQQRLRPGLELAVYGGGLTAVTKVKY
jgi:hypothetical protein